MASPIENYAVIGDGHTAALIGLDGSLDWLCAPRFDSPACFAALLGTPENGRWLLTAESPTEIARRYIGDTGVLQTTYTTDTGVATVTDLMPVGDRPADVLRRIDVLEGTVTFRHEWIVRMGYGGIRPWVHRNRIGGEDVIIATAGPDKLALCGPRMPRGAHGRHRDRFELSAGTQADFATLWMPSHEHLKELPDYSRAVADTIAEHQAWADGIKYEGPWRESVVRSLIT